MIAGRSVVASVLSCWYSVEIGPFDEATGVLKKCPTVQLIAYRYDIVDRMIVIC